jgi:hypothetical protein
MVPTGLGRLVEPPVDGVGVEAHQAAALDVGDAPLEDEPPNVPDARAQPVGHRRDVHESLLHNP